jgi:hypothetical protein
MGERRGSTPPLALSGPASTVVFFLRPRTLLLRVQQQ